MPVARRLLLARAAAAGRDRAESSPSARAGGSPTSTFSSTLILPKMRRFWKVRAIPSARARAGDRLVIVSPPKPDAPGGDALQPADDVEQRRLAGAVRADERGDLALADLHGDVVHGLEAAELDGDALDAQQLSPSVAGAPPRPANRAPGAASTSAGSRARARRPAAPPASRRLRVDPRLPPRRRTRASRPRLFTRNADLTLTRRRFVNSPAMPIGRNRSSRIMMTE